MTGAEVLVALDEMGVRLEADGDRLRYRPSRGVPSDLLGWMRTRKPELLVLLRNTAGRADGGPPVGETPSFPEEKRGFGYADNADNLPRADLDPPTHVVYGPDGEWTSARWEEDDMDRRINRLFDEGVFG